MQEYITYKNVKIAFSSIGKGDTVVLLHGFLENGTMWESISPELAKKNKIITIDLLGHGKSDSLGYLHTMSEMANLIKVVLEHLKIEKATIIGHSMGGYVALAFAEQHPKYIDKLCLVNSSAQEDTPQRKQIRLRAIEMAQNNYKTLLKLSVNNLFTKSVKEKFFKEIQAFEQQALNTSLQGYLAATRGLIKRPNREQVLMNATYPTLMIIGKKDPILNFDSLKEEALRTNTEYVVLSEGHMSHIENQPELQKALTIFLDKKL